MAHAESCYLASCLQGSNWGLITVWRKLKYDDLSTHVNGCLAASQLQSNQLIFPTIIRNLVFTLMVRILLYQILKHHATPISVSITIPFIETLKHINVGTKLYTDTPPSVSPRKAKGTYVFHASRASEMWRNYKPKKRWFHSLYFEMLTSETKKPISSNEFHWKHLSVQFQLLRHRPYTWTQIWFIKGDVPTLALPSQSCFLLGPRGEASEFFLAQTLVGKFFRLSDITS